MKNLDPEHLLARSYASLPSCPGDIRVHQWTSKSLRRRRPVLVYLPPAYSAQAPWRYPVLYVHDGQNIFDPKTSAFGVDWGLGQVIEQEIAAQTIVPVIVVAIYNNRYRLEEYTPTADYRERGGKAKEFLTAIVQELKPFIDANYHTHSDAAATGILGSSLGGLLSLYASQLFPEVFQRIGALSPSLWWSGRDLISSIAGAQKFHCPQRLWLDMGTRESNEDRNQNGVPDILDDLRLLRYVLLGRGMQENLNLHIEEVAGASHTESDWGRRVNRVLRFLYPKESSESSLS